MPSDALIGTWVNEASHPLVDAVVSGTVTFEWLESGHFRPGALPQRPRAVSRCAQRHLDDGVLRFWRDQPGFGKRISATLGHDFFEGLSRLARTPGDWQDDLKVTYRRRD